MANTILIDKLKDINDKNTMLFILNQFDPLLNKYAYKLGYEYAKSDLTVFFIETLYVIKKIGLKNEGQAINYLIKSLKNQYIKLSKNNSQLINHELPVNILYDIPSNDFNESLEASIIIKNCMKKLTPLQYDIINELYLKDTPAVEVAKKHSCSKQAITNIKKRALQKMQQYI